VNRSVSSSTANAVPPEAARVWLHESPEAGTRACRTATGLGITRDFVLIVSTLSATETKFDGLTLLWSSHNDLDRNARGCGDVHDSCG
jgi:hypothetical protein